jgi:hypothetical protein
MAPGAKPFSSNGRHQPAANRKVGRSLSSVTPKSRYGFNQRSTNMMNDGSMLRPGSKGSSKTLPKKQGVLWRKCVVESDGTRTTKRKRRWKLFLVQLQGLDLHLAKRGNIEGMKISLHHSLAEGETQFENTLLLQQQLITPSNTK